MWRCIPLLLLVLLSSHCQEEDAPLGEGLVVIAAQCDMEISSCSSPPCRFYCPANCSNASVSQTFNMESQVCREAQYLFSSENAVDILVESNVEDAAVSVITSVHTMSLARRNSQPDCMGDLSSANDASICIITCSTPDYECPRRYKKRCACPWNKPILKDARKGICVRSIRECPPSNTYILPRDGLSEFRFMSQPEELVKKRGDRVKIMCSASGNTNYQYFWYKSQTLAMGSHSIIRSSDAFLQQTGTSYFDINSVQPSDTGFYHCIVRTGDSIDSRDAKYSLVSNTGYLKVEYFDRPPTPDTISITSQENALVVILPCDLPRSEPVVNAVWYKDNTLVSDKRKFVVPEDTDDDIARGSLYIMMVSSTDAGLYTCKTQYEGVAYLVSKVDLQVTGFIGQPNIDPEIVVEVAGRSEVGGTATFHCAGIGNPVPDVTWTKEDDSRIEISDTVSLEDFKRKLIIGNVQADQERAYACTVSSGKKTRKTLLYLSIKPTSYQINFISTPTSHTLQPNVYTPFVLQCGITVDPVVESPVMYWLKNGATLDMKPSSRIKTNTTEVSLNGTTIRNSTLIFQTPNESDMGVYQCIVENKEQMRQATAYVNVEKRDLYEVYYPKEYYVSSERMKVGDAAEYCSTIWHEQGHLVTITNTNESETVFRLLVEQGLTQAWIGLNSENFKKQPGIWRWQTVNTPPDFSYWYADNPDNALGNESYAIMDVTKAGHWFDVQNDQIYPFVCSRYTATCPSVTEYFNNSAAPLLTAYEADGTTYDVGTILAVTCMDKQVAGDVKQLIECAPSGKFQPAALACPIRSSACALSTAATQATLAAYIFLLFRGVVTWSGT